MIDPNDRFRRFAALLRTEDASPAVEAAAASDQASAPASALSGQIATTRAEAFALVMAHRRADQRSSTQIAADAGLAMARPSEILNDGGYPTDAILEKLCRLYGVRFEIADLGRNRIVNAKDYEGTEYDFTGPLRQNGGSGQTASRSAGDDAEPGVELVTPAPSAVEPEAGDEGAEDASEGVVQEIAEAVSAAPEPAAPSTPASPIGIPSAPEAPTSEGGNPLPDARSSSSDTRPRASGAVEAVRRLRADLETARAEAESARAEAAEAADRIEALEAARIGMEADRDEALRSAREARSAASAMAAEMETLRARAEAAEADLDAITRELS